MWYQNVQQTHTRVIKINNIAPTPKSKRSQNIKSKYWSKEHIYVSVSELSVLSLHNPSLREILVYTFWEEVQSYTPEYVNILHTPYYILKYTIWRQGGSTLFIIGATHICCRISNGLPVMWWLQLRQYVRWVRETSSPRNVTCSYWLAVPLSLPRVLLLSYSRNVFSHRRSKVPMTGLIDTENETGLWCMHKIKR